MAKLPIARTGDQLVIRYQPVEFSYWPVGRTTRRYGLQTRIFTSDPWAVMTEGIAAKFRKSSGLREAALEFCAQAEDLYEASQASKLAFAKPLLLYYSFLNLVKAFILMAGKATAEYRPGHGMSENANLRQVEGAAVTVYPSTTKRRQLFDDFCLALTGDSLKNKRSLRLGYLMPQILFGHRLWCTAAKEYERFVHIHEINIMQDDSSRQLWLRLLIKREELARANVSQHDLLGRSRLKGDWRWVRLDEYDDLCIEQVYARQYGHRPSDQLVSVTDGLSNNRLWCSVLLHPPYRKYYLYVAPPVEQASVLPQLLSMFCCNLLLGFYYQISSPAFSEAPRHSIWGSPARRG